MSQNRTRTRKSRPTPPPQRSGNKTPVAYIIVVSVVVFSMLLAGLAAVDWGNVFSSDTEPTPDYNTDQIAIQQTVVAQNPDDVNAQVLLASMLANSGRMQEAIPVYEEAMRLDPENATVRLDFARSLQANNLNADAEAQFLKVLEIDPDNHTAHYYIGRLYLDWQPRRQEEAVDHFERVIEIAPDSFLAQQSQSVLNTIGPATPVEYQVTPIASPGIPQ